MPAAIPSNSSGGANHKLRPLQKAGRSHKHLLRHYHDIASSLFSSERLHGLEELFLAAAKGGDYERVFNFLQRRSQDVISIDVKEPRTGNTALIWAAQNGHTRIVDLLLKYGADITLRNHEGQTAMDLAPAHLCRMLLESVDRVGTSHRHLLQAAWQGNTRKVKALLGGRKALDINCSNSEGFSPLLLATRDMDMFQDLVPGHHNPTDVVKELIGKRADVTAYDDEGKTPLHLAASAKGQGSEKVVAALIKGGSDVDAPDKRSLTPIHWASQVGKTSSVLTLIEGGADVNVKGWSGATPLHVSASHGHEECSAVLLEHGADITSVDDAGMTPAEVAKGKRLKSALREAWTEATHSDRSRELTPVRPPSRNPAEQKEEQTLDDSIQGRSSSSPVLSSTPLHIRALQHLAAEERKLHVADPGMADGESSPRDSVRKLGVPRVSSKTPPRHHRTRQNSSDRATLAPLILSRAQVKQNKLKTALRGVTDSPSLHIRGKGRLKITTMARHSHPSPRQQDPLPQLVAPVSVTMLELGITDGVKEKRLQRLENSPIGALIQKRPRIMSFSGSACSKKFSPRDRRVNSDPCAGDVAAACEMYIRQASRLQYRLPSPHLEHREEEESRSLCSQKESRESSPFLPPPSPRQFLCSGGETSVETSPRSQDGSTEDLAEKEGSVVSGTNTSSLLSRSSSFVIEDSQLRGRSQRLGCGKGKADTHHRSIPPVAPDTHQKTETSTEHSSSPDSTSQEVQHAVMQIKSVKKSANKPTVAPASDDQQVDRHRAVQGVSGEKALKNGANTKLSETQNKDSTGAKETEDEGCKSHAEKNSKCPKESNETTSISEFVVSKGSASKDNARKKRTKKKVVTTNGLDDVVPYQKKTLKQSSMKPKSPQQEVRVCETPDSDRYATISYRLSEQLMMRKDQNYYPVQPTVECKQNAVEVDVEGSTQEHRGSETDVAHSMSSPGSTNTLPRLTASECTNINMTSNKTDSSMATDSTTSKTVNNDNDVQSSLILPSVEIINPTPQTTMDEPTPIIQDFLSLLPILTQNDTQNVKPSSAKPTKKSAGKRTRETSSNRQQRQGSGSSTRSGKSSSKSSATSNTAAKKSRSGDSAKGKMQPPAKQKKSKKKKKEEVEEDLSKVDQGAIAFVSGLGWHIQTDYAETDYAPSPDLLKDITSPRYGEEEAIREVKHTSKKQSKDSKTQLSPLAMSVNGLNAKNSGKTHGNVGSMVRNYFKEGTLSKSLPKLLPETLKAIREFSDDMKAATLPFPPDKSEDFDITEDVKASTLPLPDTKSGQLVIDNSKLSHDLQVQLQIDTENNRDNVHLGQSAAGSVDTRTTSFPDDTESVSSHDSDLDAFYQEALMQLEDEENTDENGSMAPILLGHGNMNVPHTDNGEGWSTRITSRKTSFQTDLDDIDQTMSVYSEYSAVVDNVKFVGEDGSEVSTLTPLPPDDYDGADETTELVMAPRGPEDFNSLNSEPHTSILRSCASRSSGRSGSVATYSTEGVGSQEEEQVIQWKKGNLLGKGAYGKVCCGLTSRGELIAVKQVELNTAHWEKAEQEYQRLRDEVDLLQTLRHRNIVRFLGTSLEGNVVNIFMQFIPGGTLASLLARFGVLEEGVVSRYTRQILIGVEYLHNNNIIHRDLKGNNIMLMPNGVIKLIDFGCARRVCERLSVSNSQVLKSMRGTPYWMAPEVVSESGYGVKSDVWSVGCTVFEMLTGKPPWADMAPMAAIFHIGSGKEVPELPDTASPPAHNFVHACLTRNPAQRPSATQLLKHSFILRRQEED
ncbi:ankyrin repeat domain-containing protein 12-like isoform X1 [Branchiostoma floridae]|uniref:Mitogen-activated protein kinase kinase kinase 19 n=2 Tax=Branchiostoma floridae TaxID=7739 RepID=A0A9J7N687_BRAFL|nr:ankyrin repeat domain-containing protein 12-like isoform X1 [Branchiostoma floridae]XP_035693021.1 ankyrin repeat domain-containing protein 12-like isoform X1 [Branchiostoma floridae]